MEKQNKRLNKALENFRNEMFEIIKEELIKVGGRKEIHHEIINDWDEDHYYLVTISAIFLQDDELFVEAHCDLHDESYNEELELYSCDDIISMIEKL